MCAMLAAICQRAAPAGPSAVACILQRPAQLLLDHGFSCQAAPGPSGLDAAAEGASEAGGSADQIAERRASHQQASTSGGVGRTWGPIYDKGLTQQHAAQWQRRQHLQTMATSQPSSYGLDLARATLLQPEQQPLDGWKDSDFKDMLLHLTEKEQQREQQQQQQPLNAWETQLRPQVSQQPVTGLMTWLLEPSLRAAPQQQHQQQQEEQWQRQPPPLEQQQQQQQQQAPEAASSGLQRLDPLLQFVQQQAGDTLLVDTSLYTALYSLSQALQVDPWPHLQPLAARCVQHLAVSKRREVVWASPEAVAATAAALLQHTTLDAAAVVGLLARRPRCLVAANSDGATAVLQQLQAQLELTQQQLGDIVLAAPALLELTPAALSQQLGYLCGTGALGLSTQQAAAVVAANPRVLVVPHSTWSASVAFLVGLGLGGEVVRALILQAPGLATAPLKDLILRWNYLRAELKGSVDDLSLAPQLLLADLQRNLGPRASFVRKHRFMLLLPSHTRGVPTLARPESWKQFKMVPLDHVLSTSVRKLCKLLGVRAEEFELYKQAWQATEGKRWSKYTLDAGKPLGTLSEDELALSLMGLCPEADRLALQGQQQAGRSMLLLQEPRRARR